MTPVIAILLAMIVGFILKEIASLASMPNYTGLIIWAAIFVFALVKSIPNLF